MSILSIDANDAVRALAQQRKLSDALQRAANADRKGALRHEDVQKIADAQAEYARATAAPKEPTVPPHKSLAEMVLCGLRPVGQRLCTGFPTLDDATRGGIPVGRVAVFTGAPGAGKSTVCTQLSDKFEREGCAVVYLAADEPASGIITRLGQLEGYSRDVLEAEGAASDNVRAAFAASCADRFLRVIDPDEDDDCSTIEHAAAVLDHIANGRPKVLVVDSLQEARCAAADGAESLRERTDAKLAAAKAIAKRGVLVVLISEMARGGYRTGDRNTDTSVLAASKESGKIEYTGAIVIGLRPVKGEPGVVDVEVAKNRLGGHRPDFRLSQDFDRARFCEASVSEPGERRMSAAESKAAEVRGKILSAVRKAPKPLRAKNAISRAVGGNKAANLAMIDELVEEGALVVVGGDYRVAPAVSGGEP